MNVWLSVADGILTMRWVHVTTSSSSAGCVCQLVCVTMGMCDDGCVSCQLLVLVCMSVVVCEDGKIWSTRSTGNFECQICNRMCRSRIGLHAHNKSHSWWWDPSYRRLSPCDDGHVWWWVCIVPAAGAGASTDIRRCSRKNSCLDLYEMNSRNWLVSSRGDAEMCSSKSVPKCFVMTA